MTKINSQLKKNKKRKTILNLCCVIFIKIQRINLTCINLYKQEYQLFKKDNKICLILSKK
jgi:hypothetical protein